MLVPSRDAINGIMHMQVLVAIMRRVVIAILMVPAVIDEFVNECERNGIMLSDEDITTLFELYEVHAHFDN